MPFLCRPTHTLTSLPNHNPPLPTLHRQSLRRSQDIKVDFASFPNNLVQLLEKCTSHEDSRYLLELETAEISGAAGAALAALNVVEVNDFKNLVHLSLRWVRARCVARVNGQTLRTF